MVRVGEWIPSNGYNPLTQGTSDTCFAYSVNPNLKIAQGVPSGCSEYATVFGIRKTLSYPIMIYIDVFGNLAIWSTNQNKWVAH